MEMSSDRWSRPEALRLLNLMLTGTLSEIKPKYNPVTGYEYCSELSREGILSCREALALIEKLVEMGVLRKELHDTVASCRNCGSEVFIVRATCPYCGSLNFSKGVVIEHLVCGYIGLEEDFHREGSGKKICPKCRKELKQQGIDFLKAAKIYKCNSCGDFFSAPSLIYRCLGVWV